MWLEQYTFHGLALGPCTTRRDVQLSRMQSAGTRLGTWNFMHWNRRKLDLTRHLLLTPSTDILRPQEVRYTHVGFPLTPSTVIYFWSFSA